MLRSASHPELVNADVTALPFPDGWADVIVAPHMLYHVPDRSAAAREPRRVLAPAGLLVAVTNGEGHLRELRDVAQQVAGVHAAVARIIAERGSFAVHGQSGAFVCR